MILPLVICSLDQISRSSGLGSMQSQLYPHRYQSILLGAEKQLQLSGSLKKKICQGCDQGEEEGPSGLWFLA